MEKLILRNKWMKKGLDDHFLEIKERGKTVGREGSQVGISKSIQLRVKIQKL